MFNLYKNKVVFISSFFVFFGSFIFSTTVLASSTSGTIDNTNRYAWSENAGWIDFGTTLGAVTVTSSGLSGYAYGENTGWISLNCSNTSSCDTVSYGVVNDGNGVLSGYAWAEGTGWIDFAPSAGGVTISSSGVFSGSAYGENVGWIIFGVSNPVTTDWRVAVVTSQTSSANTSTVSHSKGGQFFHPNYVLPSTQPKPLIPTTQLPTKTSASTNLWSLSDLEMGQQNAGVMALQKFLNNQSFVVSIIGAGSVGKESNFFGDKTKQALIKFQKKYNITPTAGYFGPKTKAVVKKLLSPSN